MDLVHGEAAQGKIEYICNLFYTKLRLAEEQNNFLTPLSLSYIVVGNNQQILLRFG